MTRTLWGARGSQATETTCESNQMLDLTEKDSKIAIINMLTELHSESKENMIKEREEGKMTMLHQIKNINTDTEIIKNERTQWK